MPINSQWLIITVKEPVMFHQTADETWLFNPNRRYIVNANRIEPIKQFIGTYSELDGASLYNRLTSGASLKGAKLLVERNRERGIGDLLFLTGPLAYLKHLAGADLEVDLMAFADRGVTLTHSPLISCGCVRCGTLEYDHLRMYNYHWMVNTVTEQNSEGDQDNVYDALYRQLGFDVKTIDPQWKRPSVRLVQDDYKNLDRFYFHIWNTRQLDLRRVGYVVVAPFANATLRCLSYTKWLEIITAISERIPVVVVGNSSLRVPDTDMSAGEFNQRVGQLGSAVINAIDSTTIRVLMALIQRSACLVCLDSAPLYMAQAVRTPAISIWGTHAPGCRIGYDKGYMDLAIWKMESCNNSPCFAYGGFPVDKCPNGVRQQSCEVLSSVSANDVLCKLNSVELKTR